MTAKAGGARLDRGERLGDAERGSRRKAARRHRPGKPFAEELVVVDDEERFVERLPAAWPWLVDCCASFSMRFRS